jgi:hypothetical protein
VQRIDDEDMRVPPADPMLAQMAMGRIEVVLVFDDLRLMAGPYHRRRENGRRRHACVDEKGRRQPIHAPSHPANG